jgi:hypothetical protein
MVSTRHQDAGDDPPRRPRRTVDFDVDEEEEEHVEEEERRAESQGGRGTRGGHQGRRADPVVREAPKRGLDIGKLHASDTPAWHNLRRQARHASYYDGLDGEDDGEEEEERAQVDKNQHETMARHDRRRSGGARRRLAASDDDHASLSDDDAIQESDGEEGSEEEEQEEEEDGGLPRYSRRERQHAQRYIPGEGGGGRGAEGRRHAGVGGGRHHRGMRTSPPSPGDPFAQRYSVRDRRTVERFNPLAFDNGSGGGLPRKRPAPGENEDYMRRVRGGDGRGDGGKPPQRQYSYSFRDRALVTIKPPGSEGPGSTDAVGRPGGLLRTGSGADRRRPGPGGRFERRGGSRLRRTGSRGAFPSDDEAALLPPQGQHQYQYHHPQSFVQPGAGPSGAIAPPPPSSSHRPAWELALAAAGINPSIDAAGHHSGPAINGGGVTARPSNAEVTPLEIDPSVTFEQVGGLDHYVRVSLHRAVGTPFFHA